MNQIQIAVISGTVIASLTYIIKWLGDYFLFDRMKKYQELKGQIIENSMFISHFLQNLGSNPRNEIIDLWITSNQECRRLSGRLIAFIEQKHFLMPTISKSHLKKISESLLILSTCTKYNDAKKAKEQVDLIQHYFKTNFKDVVPK